MKRIKRRLVFNEQEDGDAGYQDGQYRRFKLRFGKNMSNTEICRRLERNSVGYTIERFGAVNRYSPDVNGYYPLDHREQAVSLGPPSDITYNLPLYIFELTQRTPEAGTVESQTKLGYRARSHNVIDLATPSNTKTDIVFSAVDGHAYSANNSDPLGTTDYCQILVNNTDMGTHNLLAARTPVGVLEWSKIKLLLRSPRARTGKFIISVVRFRDEALVPTVEPTYDRDSLFERICSEQMYNPIKTQEYGATRKRREYFDVIRTFTKEFSPNVNAGFTNSDIRGQAFELDWFLRLNNVVNFTQRIGPDYRGGQEYLNEDSLLTDISNHRVWNHPHDRRQRLFLMVQMSYYDQPHTLGSEFDPDIDGSFDLEVHNKYVWKNTPGV